MPHCTNKYIFNFHKILHQQLISFLCKVGNNEGSLMTGVKLPNLLGRGERLQVQNVYSSSEIAFKGNTINCILGGLHIWYKKVEQLQPEPAEATARETEEFSHRKHLPGQMRSVPLSCSSGFQIFLIILTSFTFEV